MSENTDTVDTIHDAMGQICAFAEHVFDGTNARFALVLWPEGLENEPDAIAVFSTPQAHAATAVALATASSALRPGLNQ